MTKKQTQFKSGQWMSHGGYGKTGYVRLIKTTKRDIRGNVLYRFVSEYEGGYEIKSKALFTQAELIEIGCKPVKKPSKKRRQKSFRFDES